MRAYACIQHNTSHTGIALALGRVVTLLLAVALEVARIIAAHWALGRAIVALPAVGAGARGCGKPAFAVSYHGFMNGTHGGSGY